MNINGHEYNVGKLDAMRQFHVARRLGPAMWTLIIAALGSVREALPEGGATSLRDVFTALDNKAFASAAAGSIGPLLGVLATMADADAEFVIKTCLSVVTRQQVAAGQGWAPVQNAEGALMFSDIEMPHMMQLVFAVLRENLGNFTSALPLQG